MDDLLCEESVDQNNFTPQNSTNTNVRNEQEQNNAFCVAAHDISVLEDKRVLENLLIKEWDYLPSNMFLDAGRSHVNTDIRKVLMNWMQDLCEHRECEMQVFFVAANLLDRFLSITLVHRNQLQLGACACMLIASKIRQSTFLSVDLLAFYTEDSVTVEDIRQWELLILAKLGWDACSVTTCDFVEPLLQLIPEINNHALIRKHALTFLTVALCEKEFVSAVPSLVTASVLMVAMEGLHLTVVPNVYERLAAAIKSTPEAIRSTQNSIYHYVYIFATSQQVNQPSNEAAENDTHFLDEQNIAKNNKLKAEEREIYPIHHQQKYQPEKVFTTAIL